ncbi:MAG: ribosome biogenesis GTPase YlqF [Spirochaetaceae bacterium]|jgi:ribosome biogenesis GTPase A|nr:ribosome biogenesis GTPase YlqF [Spirochaetaceae bacterium]
MQVQWFPGHMHRGRKQIRENLKRVDIVLEIVDARAPLSSSNPLLKELTQQKKKILILNKMDLADPIYTKLWMETLKNENDDVIAVSAKNNNSMKQIPQLCEKLFCNSRWFNRRPVRALIMGVPNVGKSTIINNLAKNKKAPVANSPGFTKDVLRYEAGKKLQIFDSPGILWPKFEIQETGLTLACLGSVRDSVLPLNDVIEFFLDILIAHYPKLLEQRYSIELPSEDIVQQIGLKRGAILPGGIVDRDKTILLILRDFREGRIGRITLENLGSISEEQYQDKAVIIKTQV